MLVALGVFSIAGLALLELSTNSTNAARALDKRFLAQVQAENMLAETYVNPNALIVGASSGSADQRGHTLEWTRIVAPTPREGLLRIEVSVSDPESGQTLFRLNALRPAR